MKGIRRIISLLTVLAAIFAQPLQLQAQESESGGEIRSVVIQGVALKVAKMTMSREERGMFDKIRLSRIEICDLSSAGEKECSAFLAKRRTLYSRAPYQNVDLGDEEGRKQEVYIKMDGEVITRLIYIYTEDPAKSCLFDISCRVSESDAESLLQSVPIH